MECVEDLTVLLASFYVGSTEDPDARKRVDKMIADANVTTQLETGLFLARMIDLHTNAPDESSDDLSECIVDLAVAVAQESAEDRRKTRGGRLMTCAELGAFHDTTQSNNTSELPLSQRGTTRVRRRLSFSVADQPTLGDSPTRHFECSSSSSS